MKKRPQPFDTLTHKRETDYGYRRVVVKKLIKERRPSHTPFFRHIL